MWPAGPVGSLSSRGPWKAARELMLTVPISCPALVLTDFTPDAAILQTEVFDLVPPVAPARRTTRRSILRTATSTARCRTRTGFRSLRLTRPGSR